MKLGRSDSKNVLRFVRAFSLAVALLLTAIARAATPADLPTPTFSPRGGFFTNNVAVQIAGGAAEAVIRFTLDGTEPTERSARYTAPLALNKPAIVRARVYGPNSAPGAVTTESYLLSEPDLASYASNLPWVVLTTYGHEIEKSSKTGAHIHIVDPGASRSLLSESRAFDGFGLVHVRGKSSLRYPKRSLTLKTCEIGGEPQKVSLLDLPRDSDWVLYAPYPDKTLMRDVLGYELSREMGHWAPRTRYVEVFINEEGGKLSRRHYAGVYVFEEKIKRAKERINISKLDPKDTSEPKISGGYIFKKDHTDRGNTGPATFGGVPQFRGMNSGSRFGFPTGPGGFPGDPAGFLATFAPESGNGDRLNRSSPRTVPFNGNGNGNDEPRRRALDGPPDPGAPTTPETMTRGVGPRGTRIVVSQDGQMRFDGGDGGGGTIQAFPRGFFNGPSDVDAEGSDGFGTTGANYFFYVEPKPKEITGDQKKWLHGYLNQFEASLYGPEFRNPTNGYAAYIDADSFIDYHLLVEVTKNIDGFRFSTFYHKDRGGKLKMEPAWDWNLSFGNANGKQGWIPEYWYWPQLDDQQYSYFRRLFEDPDFAQRYVDRWAVLHASVFSVANLHALIDRDAARLEEAQNRNFKRWRILGREVWPNTFVGKSYPEEVDWMKDWIRQRLDWIDRQFLAPPTLGQPDPTKQSGDSLALSAPRGTIYFTRDGTDPRLSGGNISPRAQAYTADTPLSAHEKVVARARLDKRWSSPLVPLPSKSRSG